MCMVSCPFGAISDKSQIFQLSHALREGTEIIAEIAPAYINQFGEDVTPGKFRSALKQLGFSNIYEVALGPGADPDGSNRPHCKKRTP